MKVKYYYKEKKRRRKLQQVRKRLQTPHYMELKELAAGDPVKLKEFYRQFNRRLWLRLVKRRILRTLEKPRLPKYLSFARWVLYDFIAGQQERFFGVYCYVALPGEGKTISMVEHAEKMRERYGKKLFILSNFKYEHADARMEHWSDIIYCCIYCMQHKLYLLVLWDEMHLTFDSMDWKAFPKPLDVALSENRHINLQFCSTVQRYDSLPGKVKRLLNYVVICKNILGQSRLFRDYFFRMIDYENGFSGKRKDAEYIREFVADNYMYSLYDSKEMVERLLKSPEEEKALLADPRLLCFSEENLKNLENLKNFKKNIMENNFDF